MAQAQGFNIGLILGPIEVGVVVASCLFGCAVVQTYVYYKRFLKDNWKIKALVNHPTALQIPHLLCVVATMWTMSTTHYGEPQTLNYLPDSTVAAVILSAPITFPVHAFFVYRLYRLAEDRILPAICLLMAFVRLAFNLTLGITGIQMRNSIEYEQHWSWMITAVLVTTAACDLTIAGALCYHLGAKRQVGIKR
ncbi:hypothetical protein HYDPIDRAFT_98733 [Hydnomerulius pinastri MD-312]|uniref:Integral membrane protein n=1 Tax=Hydnomerulius pinastri MD-312 TaxID=994086 RepID=A0A0C9W2Y8_9AGAM|nr:hypothetical protein HYDPIDRAFT_98733 [Hydnomerulius pinastri MD-312]